MNVSRVYDNHPYRYEIFDNKDPRLCFHDVYHLYRWNQKYDTGFCLHLDNYPEWPRKSYR